MDKKGLDHGIWRRPTIADRSNKCRARNPLETAEFDVEWNDSYQCWALAGSPHSLILVSEILDVPAA